MNLATFFPYRNDVRKVLIPYLKELTVEQWYATHSNHPNSIAWIVEHIARSEDEWINVIALQAGLQLPPKLESPQQLLQAYIDVRNQTDFRLKSILFDENAPAIQLPTYSDGWQPPSPPTLHWIFHHVFDHETYHVGQIGVISRLNGFAGPSF
ncbi:DinB family protein [Paenibacillus senegalimassiliensis]|uniref:DinB family protein n=1 Tax=Paenibacillus senegalimassiliensis TaxID=1737426 RepID=UPI00073F9630|nr:DinB family protein [Paenibacillus senegalimassiliensis]